MGNKMSQEGGGGAGYHHLNGGGPVLEPYGPHMAHLRGGDSANHQHGVPGSNGLSANRASCGHSSSLTLNIGPGGDVHEVPAEGFYAARTSRKSCRQNTSLSTGSTFNFNNHLQPNPWRNVDPHERRDSEHAHDFISVLDKDVPVKVAPPSGIEDADG
jgi:hypothetical protein